MNPEVTIFVSPIFPNEALLSAAFSLKDPSRKSRYPGTRLAVSDDHGQSFDSVINYMARTGVFEVHAFPRRGRELRLELMEDDEKLGQFRIPNPCPGPHPTWKAALVPITITNAPLEITLERFTSDGIRLRTQCAFTVREHGRETTAWLPMRFEISDATGNHWYPAVSSPLKDEKARLVKGRLLGALWAEEDAWKLRVEFRRADDDAKGRGTCTVEFLAKPEQVRDGSDAH